MDAIRGGLPPLGGMAIGGCHRRGRRKKKYFLLLALNLVLPNFPGPPSPSVPSHVNKHSPSPLQSLADPPCPRKLPLLQTRVPTFQALPSQRRFVPLIIPVADTEGPKLGFPSIETETCTSPFPNDPERCRSGCTVPLALPEMPRCVAACRCVPTSVLPLRPPLRV